MYNNNSYMYYQGVIGIEVFINRQKVAVRFFLDSQNDGPWHAP